METNFETAVQFTSLREGLYQCARSDPGNWTGGGIGQGSCVGTMRGISAPVLARWLGDPTLVTTRVMKGLTISDFRAIARTLYWRALNADFVPSGLDLLLFDFGFNSGVARAAKQLQRVLCLEPYQIDGDIGPETLAACGAVPAAQIAYAVSARYAMRMQTDLGVSPDGIIGPITLAAIADQAARIRLLIYACASQQEAAYRSFRNFQIDGAGWLARLDARVAAALRLLDDTPSGAQPAST